MAQLESEQIKALEGIITVGSRPAGRLVHYPDVASLPEDLSLLPFATLTPPRPGQTSSINMPGVFYAIETAAPAGSSNTIFLHRLSGNGPDALVAKTVLTPKLFIEYPDCTGMYVPWLAKKVQGSNDYDPEQVVDLFIAKLQEFAYFEISGMDIAIAYRAFFDKTLQEALGTKWTIDNINSLEFRRSHEEVYLNAVTTAMARFGSLNLGPESVANRVLDRAEATWAAFLREDELLRALAGIPHILPSQGFALDPETKQIYFLTPRLYGENLETTIYERPYNLPERIKWFTTIAQTIQKAHDRGIAHGDLKPENVLLTTSGDIFLIDWGLGRFLTDNNPQIYLGGHGTPGYAAPEIERGGAPTVASDIYALGELLNTLLITALQSRELVINPAIQAIIDKATTYDPQQRYASAIDMLTDLRNTGFFGTPPPTGRR